MTEEKRDLVENVSPQPRRMDNVFEIENSGRLDSHCHRKMDMHKTRSSTSPSETLDWLRVCEEYSRGGQGSLGGAHLVSACYLRQDEPSYPNKDSPATLLERNSPRT